MLFAEAEDFSIYDGQIQTLVTWSNGCYNRLSELFNAIKELWINVTSRNKLRQALLAYGGENGAFPPTRNGCIHSLSMRERG